MPVHSDSDVDRCCVVLCNFIVAVRSFFLNSFSIVGLFVAEKNPVNALCGVCGDTAVIVFIGIASHSKEVFYFAMV